jgi:hypothetical protein
MSAREMVNVGGPVHVEQQSVDQRSNNEAAAIDQLPHLCCLGVVLSIRGK